VSLIDISPSMISCRARDEVRAASLTSWARSDWGRPPRVELDDSDHPDVLVRIEQAWRKLLVRAVEDGADFHLFLEDDIEPVLALRHNLERWPPLMRADPRRPFYASLYWCHQPIIWRDQAERYLVGVPEAAWGAQALVLSRSTLRYIVRCWDEVNVRHQDIRIARLAGRLSRVYYHVPSLVQHTGAVSTWGNGYHRSDGFSPTWRVGDSLADPA
jgi:hypothetical protein